VRDGFGPGSAVDLAEAERLRRQEARARAKLRGAASSSGQGLVTMTLTICLPTLEKWLVLSLVRSQIGPVVWGG
jgi:hypothetical protein